MVVIDKPAGHRCRSGSTDSVAGCRWLLLLLASVANGEKTPLRTTPLLPAYLPGDMNTLRTVGCL